MRRAIWSNALVAALAFTSLSDCVDPTEVVLHISTDVSCSVVEGNGVGIAVGRPGVDDGAFATVAQSCDDGGVGSLVITPSGDVNDALGVRVVLGVNTPTASCAPSYSGCIVARRALRYSPHTPLTLPIDLQQSCLDTACDPNSTCVNGQCVDAGTTCVGSACDLPDAGSTPPPDAGGCHAIAMMPLASGVPVSTPHIARFTGGYAIAWEQPAGTLVGMMLDDNGSVLAPITQLGVNSTTGFFGPIGSDGKSWAITRWSGTTLGVDVVVPPAPAKQYPAQGMYPPIGGVLWDALAGHYVLATTPSNTTNPLGNVYDVSTTTNLGVIGTIPAASYVSTAQADPTTLYVAGTISSTSTCVLYPCSYGGTTVTCQGQSINTIGLCTSMRVAATPGHYFAAAYIAQQTSIYLYIDGTMKPSYLSVVDDPQAMIALTSGPNDWRVVWRSNDVLTTSTASSGPPFPTLTGPLGFKPNTGAGFDAVADDPSTTSYAVVWYAAEPNMQPSIRFMRKCN